MSSTHDFASANLNCRVVGATYPLKKNEMIYNWAGLISCFATLLFAFPLKWYFFFVWSGEATLFPTCRSPDYFRQISLVKIVKWKVVCRRNFITWGDCWHFSSSLHELQQGKKSKSLLFSVLSPPLNNLKLQCGKWVVSGKVRVDWSLFFHCKISCCQAPVEFSLEDLGTVGVIRITGSNTASLRH